MRSLWAKIDSLADDMKDRDTDISFLSEVWEKKDNINHQHRLEELLHMKNVNYISTPRPGTKRGGGTAIAVSTDKFIVTKLNIHIPKPLEIVWALLKPKSLNGISKIILCSFYSPPNSRKISELIDHMSSTLQSLQTLHPGAKVIIAGDRNQIKDQRLLSIHPFLRLIVTKPTRNTKLLNIVLTDLHNLYQEPLIIPPVSVDPDKTGCVSDHFGVLAIPINNNSSHKSVARISKTVRPIPQSSLNAFGQAFTLTDWSFLNSPTTSSDMVKLYQDFTCNMVDHFLPQKTVTITNFDQPWMNDNLKQLVRKRKREYTKNGKSQKYFELKEKFTNGKLKEIKKYKDKVTKEVVEGKRGSVYKAIRKLADEPSSSEGSFTLPSHLERNLSPLQSAEIFADTWSAISQKYDPISIPDFPPNLRAELEAASTPPTLQEYEVFMKISTASKPNGTVPGDIPKKVVQEVITELAEPATMLFNKITKTAEYPRQWVIEHATPIPKVKPPQDEDDLRLISATPFLSKVYESILGSWLLPHVEPYLDPGQCGGLKGTSVTHYLVKLLHHIHFHLDKPQPHAVLLALVDMRKAFNKISHQLVIEDLHAMKVPGWLLKILISYLTKRSLVVRYQGAVSSHRDMPGSTPQGCYLGNMLFIIKFNGAMLRPPIPRLMSPSYSPHHPPPIMHVKFIDDASQAAAVNLRKFLIPDPVTRPLPLNYHERTQQVLTPHHNQLQQELTSLQHFANNNLMEVNPAKTKIMMFNFSKTLDFPPELSVGGEDFLSTVTTTKLLGVIINSDLTWEENCQHIVKKASSKLWILRKLKNLNLDTKYLLDFYVKEIRCHLEYQSPVWAGALTYSQSRDLQRVERAALAIITSSSPRYTSYTGICEHLGIEKLTTRRAAIALRFARKTATRSRHTNMFKQNPSDHNTRHQTKYRQFNTHTTRFQRSPLVHLTNLLNGNT